MHTDVEMRTAQTRRNYQMESEIENEIENEIDEEIGGSESNTNETIENFPLWASEDNYHT